MNRKSFSQMIRGLICMLMVGSLLVGCSSAMRKKFIRQKKKTDEEINFVPILEPIDYPNQLETSKIRYDYFYALLKVWHKDALTLIDDEHTDKRIVYTITQMKVQLEELNKIFVDGATKEKTVEAVKAVELVLANYDNPPAFRNRDIIRRQLQRLMNAMIKPLSFENIKEDFIN